MKIVKVIKRTNKKVIGRAREVEKGTNRVKKVKLGMGKPRGRKQVKIGES